MKKLRAILQLWRRREGNTAVEFAVLAPVILSALVATIDLGIGLYENMQVENAAQAGAQYAVVKGWNSSAIQGAVASASSMSGISASPAPSEACGCPSGTSFTAASCGSTCAGGALAGTYVTVNAQVQYSTIFSYPGLSNPMTLTGQAVVRVQ